MNDNNRIKSFRGKYKFLSNSHPCMVVYEDVLFPSAEHAFQAAKTLNIDKRITMSVCPTADDARYCGRQLELRADWEQIKLSVMKEIVKDKFLRNISFRTDIRQMLIDTEDTYLEFGGPKSNKFWGTLEGEGQNWLGKILMEVRDELRQGNLPIFYEDAPRYEFEFAKLKVPTELLGDARQSITPYYHNTLLRGQTHDGRYSFMQVYAKRQDILSYAWDHADVEVLEPTDLRKKYLKTL